jgi:predicted kinase
MKAKQRRKILQKMHPNKPKILYILRSLPGAGKSTLSKKLSKGGMTFSTDEFFESNGKYNFDIEKAPEAHLWNQRRALEAMKDGISPIVVDNTNIESFEAKSYVLAAKHYGYKVKIEEPQTPWKFNVDELARRNKHGVPKDVIQSMLERWEHDMTPESIEKSEVPKGRAYLDAYGNLVED